MKKIDLPICYVNLIAAALQQAKAKGLFGLENDDIIKSCIEEVETNFIQPLQELDKDGEVIIK